MTADLSAIRARLVSEWCTGLTAAWCPIHGDCICDREQSMDDRGCPLHAVDSDHATVPSVPTPAIRADNYWAAIQRVRALHHPHACPPGIGAITACAFIHGGTCAKVGRCSGCGEPYPCPTLRALDGAE